MQVFCLKHLIPKKGICSELQKRGRGPHSAPLVCIVVRTITVLTWKTIVKIISAKSKSLSPKYKMEWTRKLFVHKLV